MSLINPVKGRPGARERAGPSVSLALAHLCFRQVETVGQLLPLGSHHVVVLLEGSFQAQQLGRGEGRPDAFRFPGEGTVEEQAVLGHVVAWNRGREQSRSVKVTTQRA